MVQITIFSNVKCMHTTKELNIEIIVKINLMYRIERIHERNKCTFIIIYTKVSPLTVMLT